jgi:hypothetical protein
MTNKIGDSPIFFKELEGLPPLKIGDVIKIEGGTYCVRNISQIFNQDDGVIFMDIGLTLMTEPLDINLN